MNFQKVQRKNRKAISPVLATVILIAITLIAAVAIAGFVFGLFGSFTSTAQVQASVTNCSYTGTSPTGTEACNLVLTNSGSANTMATASCSLTYGGSTHIGTTSGAAYTTGIPAGQTALAICTGAAGAAPTVGAQISGSVILTNGGNALFSATAS